MKMSWIDEAARAEVERAPRQYDLKSVHRAHLERMDHLFPVPRIEGVPIVKPKVPEPEVLPAKAAPKLRAKRKPQTKRMFPTLSLVDAIRMTLGPLCRERKLRWPGDGPLELIADIISAPEIPEGPSVAQIQSIVARHFDVPLAFMCTDGRREDVILPRHVAIYLCCKLTDRSTPQIGRRFGGRDHTTIIHARNKIEKRIAEDAQFAAEIEALKSKVMGVAKNDG